GIHADRALAENPDVAPPVRPSTTFEDGTGRRYRRTSHETTERLEAVIGSLEGGDAVAYASGMAAVAAALDHYQPRRIVLPDAYHGVVDLVRRLEEQGRVNVVPPDELGEGDVWWVETPSNPKCTITDLDVVVAGAHGVGAIVVCDATFATPIAMNPLSFGVDMVMHSATKAMAGHSDALAGVLVVGDAGVADQLRDERTLTGAVPGSLDAWLALRGIRTLALRVERATESAQTIAEQFHGRGIVTYYPGLASHPGHDIAQRQMRGQGSMLSIDLGSEHRAAAFVDAVEVFTSATSLGGVESLAEHRIRSDPSMDPGLVRLSIGIEDADDLIADIDQALAAIDA
ncbi:MAG: trans-sulfuration enzyme family protein, partial [Acidimicrobiia bacterium]